MPDAVKINTNTDISRHNNSDVKRSDSGIRMCRLEGLPDFQAGDSLAERLIQHLESTGTTLVDKDILVIAHKVVSKCEGAARRLSEVTPSPQAIEVAESVGKDPRKVQVILDQSKRILRAVRHHPEREGVLIAEHNLGYICANAAVDESNSAEADLLITLPDNPDRSARELADALEHHFGVTLGIVISDTFGRPWRLGQTNVAIGVANVPALNVMAGETDAYGRPLTVTAPALGDELAAASGLLMEKSAQTPVIVFRGLDWQVTDSSGQDLIRAQQEDLFR